MMSGIRKDPPISTSSPRLTITSRSRAWPARQSRTAAALLLTTWAHSAPVRARNIPSTCERRDDRSPAARSNSRFEYPRAVSRTAASASSGNGARPRLVWTTIPAALITRRIGRDSLDAISPGSIERIRSLHASRESGTRSSPAAARAAPTTSRSASTTTARGWDRRTSRAASLVSRDATDGRLRSPRESGIADGGSDLRQFPEEEFLSVEGVLPHELLGELRIALADRFDDLPMLPDRPLDLPRHGEDQAEAPELHDQVLHDRVELLVPAGAQEDVVEFVVQVEQPPKVLLLRLGLDLAVDRLHLRQVGLLARLDRAPRRVSLEDHLQVVEVGDVALRQGCDDGSLARHHGDEARRFQLTERLPDRRPADPELVGQFRFGDAGAGNQLSVDDGIADRLDDPFAEGHVVVDPDFQFFQWFTPAPENEQHFMYTVCKKNVNPGYWPPNCKGISLFGVRPWTSACAQIRDTLVWRFATPVPFYLRKFRREARHALGPPLHRPLLHAERAGDAADAVGRRRRAGDLSLGPDPRRDHAGRGGNRCGDAAESGDPLPVVPCPLRGRVARCARRGGTAVRRAPHRRRDRPRPDLPTRRDRPPRRVLRLDLRLPAGKVVRPGPALVRRTRRSGGEGRHRPVRGERFRRDPRPPSPPSGGGGLPPPSFLLRPGARDALLPPAGPQVGGGVRGGYPPGARARQQGTAGRSPSGGRGGDQLPGCAAGGVRRGGPPDPHGGA